MSSWTFISVDYDILLVYDLPSAFNIVPRIIILPFNHFEKKKWIPSDNNELCRIQAHYTKNSFEPKKSHTELHWSLKITATVHWYGKYPTITSLPAKKGENDLALIKTNYCASGKLFHHMLARLSLSCATKNIYKGRLTSCNDLLLKDHYL